jgi:hypothetical protein
MKRVLGFMAIISLLFEITSCVSTPQKDDVLAEIEAEYRAFEQSAINTLNQSTDEELPNLFEQYSDGFKSFAKEIRVRSSYDIPIPFYGWHNKELYNSQDVINEYETRWNNAVAEPYARLQVLLEKRKQREEKLGKIQFSIQGQSAGIKVILDISNLPYQKIDASSANPSVIMQMRLVSDRDITLSGFADNLLFAFNDKMCATRLISFKTRREYPRNLLKSSEALFDIEVSPDPFWGFIIGGTALKVMILRVIENPETRNMNMNKVHALILETYRAQFVISSLSLTIPLNEVLIDTESTIPLNKGLIVTE